MKAKTIIAGMLALCVTTGCNRNATDTIVEVAPTGDEGALIERTEKLGRAIYTHDQYAARATDLAAAHQVDLVKAGAHGWITESRPDGCTVTFVATDSQPWRSVCVVTFTGHAEPNIVLTNKDLTEPQSAMFSARQLAIESVEKPCSEVYNTVVIPRDGEPGWVAYALAATDDPDVIVVGGHYRATTSADGRTILERRGFTRSCLTLSKRPKDMPSGAELSAYTMSHLLDNTPTEIHIFINLHYGKPLYVATPDGCYWYIKDGKVRLLKQS